MTSWIPFVAVYIMFQCGLTLTGTLEKQRDIWSVSENGLNDNNNNNGRSHKAWKESTECSCTCEVKVDTTAGQGQPGSNTQQDEELQDGGLGTLENGWSSDGHASVELPIQWMPDDQSDTDYRQPPFGNEDNTNNMNNNVADDTFDSETPDRYKGFSWGHGSRYLWKSLKDTMCIRQPCNRDSDCCFRWNICDKSAKVCTNCWYGHPCLSERDCCFDFPFCQRKWKMDENGQLTTVESGRCANQRST